MSVIDSVFLFEIGLIIIAATVATILLKKFKQPNVLSYVVAGILIGPFGLSLVSSGANILALSELGIAFLLFGTAVKINLNKLKGLGSVVTIIGVVQVLVTFALGYIAAVFMGLAEIPAMYIGMILAFSSTMIVIKVLADTYRLNTLYGRIAIGVLIVQDLLVVVAIAMLSSLGGPVSYDGMLAIVLNGFGLFSIALVSNRLIFPYLLNFISDSKELLFLTSISTCFVFMGLADFFGFSIALGAFIAGLSLSAFRYNLEISGKVLPLRDFFSTMFFVTLGMQLNLALGFSSWMLAISLIILVLVVKPLIIMVIGWLQGYGRA
ncbi:MAG: hypothetical protein GOV15_03645, partial [Candidatus Diapherotrites archaeon]|nr:hypothetical protein [Candidatus Diapherotrites archaeon]